MPGSALRNEGGHFECTLRRINAIHFRAERNQGEKNVMRSGQQIFARLLGLLALMVLVASCGSGSVGTPPVNDPTKITILPDNATLYSGLPTTFSITGGTGAYLVTSSNQAVIPVATATMTSSSLTIVPNPVAADTVVTLSARDTGSTAPVSVTLTVKPGTVSNTVTVTPSSGACAPAICSGGDAVVSVLISQGGIPLAARGVRFDVVSGDVRFITSPAGAPETVALSATTATDETGIARIRMRALDSAANQTAIIQITDIAGGAYQRTTVFIARSSTAQTGFFVVPTSVTYTGPDNTRCADGSTSLTTEVFVFGGTPPYTISNTAPGAFDLNTSFVASSGGSFRITPKGACVDGATFIVTDQTGRTVTVTASNKLGTTVPVAAFFVTPTSVSLGTCTDTANVIAGGGSGTY